MGVGQERWPAHVRPRGRASDLLADLGSRTPRDPTQSDVEIAVHDEIADGNTTTARWSWSGTHRGPFMDIPPTGKSVSGIAGMGFYRVVDGLIDEEWVIEDTVGLLQQLGVIPQPRHAEG